MTVKQKQLMGRVAVTVGGAPRGDALERSCKTEPVTPHIHVLFREIPSSLNIIAARRASHRFNFHSHATHGSFK